tara:strand:+ start:585 stop:788 length:204 start_codon:yes stop_codon:yes gene_type:complete
MVFPNSSTEYTIMVIIKQDETQFVFLKGNAFSIKGRIFDNIRVSGIWAICIIGYLGRRGMDAPPAKN